MIDDKTRAMIAEQLTASKEAEAAIELAMKPFTRALCKIGEARELLLEHYEVDIAGNCESCDKLLFAGDHGHRCEDGPILCTDHSPTWGDCEQQWLAVAGGDDDEPERRAEFEAAIAAHLAAGGSRDDKITYEL